MTQAPRPILVLGGTGRLGRLLRNVWPSDTPVIWQTRRPESGWELCDFDVDSKAVERLMKNACAVLCLAGVTDEYARREGASYDENARLAKRVIKAAGRSGRPRVLLASSAAIYGRRAGLLNEDTPPLTPSPYGLSKMDMEQVAKLQADETGVPVTCLRIGNVAGAEAALGGWSPGCQLDCFEDKRTPRRSYIGPVSLARCIVDLAHVPNPPQVVNVAASKVVSMGDLLDAAHLAWTPRPAPKEALPELHLDVSRLSALLSQPIPDATPEDLVAEWRHAC